MQQAIPMQQTAPLAISMKVLLGIYAILPLSFLFYILDSYYWDGRFKYQLPTSPEDFVWLALLFGTPHIIASNMILVTNKDYFKTYWKRLVYATLGIIVFFAVGNVVLSYNMLFAIVATATIIHVVKQQHGIGNAAYRLSGPSYLMWSWSGILIGVVLYNAIYLRHIFTPGEKQILMMMLVVLGTSLLLFSFYHHGRIKSRFGKLFFWGNVFMVLASLYFFVQGYFFLAVLCPRVIHDLTAFVVYTVHDHNRHHDKAQNWLYRFMRPLHLSSFVVVPALAIGLTWFFQHQADIFFSQMTLSVFGLSIPGAIGFGFVGYLSLMHYYTESFTWRYPSPYRPFIRFKE